MKKNTSIFTYTLLGIALLMALSLIPIWEKPSVAGVTFTPQGAQAPKRSSGGASRSGSSCGTTKAINSAAVTPLLPTTNIGLTMAERPTIFVYVPETSAKKAFFSIQDEDTNNHYQTTLRLQELPGVMEVKLPDSAPALKTGKNYKWSLVMICTEDLEPDSPSVSGWIRRVEPNRSLVNQQNMKSQLESVSKLAEAGIWYDSLSTLAQLRRSQPKNQALTVSWQQLLKSVGLEALANEPLIN